MYSPEDTCGQKKSRFTIRKKKKHQQTNDAKVFAVKLARARKHDGTGRHVQTHSKRFRRKESLQTVTFRLKNDKTITNKQKP
jgi:hypothetical protein